VAGTIMQSFQSGDYPSLTEFATRHVMKPGYMYSREFEFGLDLIIEGLDRRLRSANRVVGREGVRAIKSDVAGSGFGVPT